jgi:Tfp pilus assembly protein PilO
MTRQVKRQQILCGVMVGLTLLNLPIYLLLVKPEIDAELSGHTQAQAIRQQAAGKEKVLNALRGLENQINVSKFAYQDFSRQGLFSSESAGSELMRELEQVTLKAGLLKNSASYRFEDPSRFGVRRIAFSLPIEGSYASIRKFLNLLERGSKFIIIDSLTLETDRESSGGVIRMDLNLSTLCAVAP